MIKKSEKDILLSELKREVIEVKEIKREYEEMKKEYEQSKMQYDDLIKEILKPIPIGMFQ